MNVRLPVLRNNLPSNTQKKRSCVCAFNSRWTVILSIIRSLQLLHDAIHVLNANPNRSKYVFYSIWSLSSSFPASACICATISEYLPNDFNHHNCNERPGRRDASTWTVLHLHASGSQRCFGACLDMAKQTCCTKKSRIMSRCVRAGANVWHIRIDGFTSTFLRRWQQCDVFELATYCVCVCDENGGVSTGRYDRFKTTSEQSELKKLKYVQVECYGHKMQRAHQTPPLIAIARIVTWIMQSSDCA